MNLKHFLLTLGVTALTLSPLCAEPPATRKWTHERLHGVLWIQTSPEHDFMCRQLYDLAKMRVEEALKDKKWTASLEQTGNYSKLPPAVIMDLDETVIDNSPFQGRLVDRDADYVDDWWREWVQQGEAEALPGAPEFIHFLLKKGVKPIFVTNRDANGEKPTLENLRRVFNYPELTGEDILSQGEAEDWTSNKTSRRELLAKKYRIVLLMGDDYNDFTYLGKKPGPQERVEKSKEHAEMWGKKWILMPNPLYGNWEKALYQYNYGSSDAEKLNQKYKAMDLKEEKK